MLLTTKQVAQKLKCRPNYVANLIRTGRLQSATTPKPGAQKTQWEVDEKVVREFLKTWTGVPPRGGWENTRQKGNGHAPETLPLDIPTMVALAARLERIEARLIRVQEVVLDTDAKLGNLLAVWK